MAPPTAGLARRPRTASSSALPAAPSSQRVTRLISAARGRGAAPSNTSGADAPASSTRSSGSSPGRRRPTAASWPRRTTVTSRPSGWGRGRAIPAAVGRGGGGPGGCEPVAGAGGLLVALLGRIPGHAAPERAEHRFGVAVQGGLQGGDQGGVALGGHGAGAGAEAAAQPQQGGGRPPAAGAELGGAAAQGQGVLN